MSPTDVEEWQLPRFALSTTRQSGHGFRTVPEHSRAFIHTRKHTVATLRTVAYSKFSIRGRQAQPLAMAGVLTAPFSDKGFRGL